MKLLIITNRESDLSSLLVKHFGATTVDMEKAKAVRLDEFDSVAVLGGTERGAVVFHHELRTKLEAYADSGKKLFLEFVNSFRYVYSASAKRISHHRLVVADDEINGLEQGELLDTHANSYSRPHFLMPNTKPLLYYHPYVPAHDRAPMSREQIESGEVAFWRCENVLSCAFKICDFRKARLAPKERFDSLVSYIVKFLTNETIEIDIPETVKHRDVTDFECDLSDCIKKSLAWLERYLIDDGNGGILEGLSHEILPDGAQLRANSVRTDCSGEAAGAFFLSGEADHRRYADNLSDFCYGPMMIKGTMFDGMLRWTEEAWGVCYQDDVARALIPTLISAKLGITDKHVPSVVHALEFLMRTTAKDGLRALRTDNLVYLQNGTDIASLSEEEHGYPCSHYNSYYSAALILCYLVTGREDMLEMGVRGLETLMSLYPETTREQSETSELCRLVLPLSVMYMATKKEAHKEMLERVVTDLERMAYGGAYREWDTGYKANCSKKIDSECSLLATNGDPVADLLYSVNWLPLGFAFAYEATRDEKYKAKWHSVAEFFIYSQTLSENELIDGSWARGYDLDRKENYGVPHDVGWGPCSVESGWTVAEITMGLEYFKYIS